MNVIYVNRLIEGYLAKANSLERQLEIIHYLVKTKELGVKEFVYLMKNQEQWNYELNKENDD